MWTACVSRLSFQFLRLCLLEVVFKHAVAKFFQKKLVLWRKFAVLITLDEWFIILNDLLYYIILMIYYIILLYYHNYLPNNYHYYIPIIRRVIKKIMVLNGIMSQGCNNFQLFSFGEITGNYCTPVTGSW